MDAIKHINKAFLIEVLPGSALTVSAMLVHCVGTKGAKPFFVRRLKRESQPAERWLSRKPPLWSSHTSSLHVATRGSCLHIWLLFSQRKEYLNSGQSKRKKKTQRLCCFRAQVEGMLIGARGILHTRWFLPSFPAFHA